MGFIAGEGSFHARLSEDSRANFGIQISMVFTLMLNECDEELLKEIHQFVGAGNITYESNRGRVCWRITNREGCKKLAKFIESNKEPLFECSDKYESFERWKYLLDNIENLNKTRQGKREFISKAKSVNKNNRGLSAEEWIDRME